MSSFLSVNRTSVGADLEPVVLAVNGDESMRKWIEATVSAAGLQVLTFATANELRARVGPEALACVVLDVTLPDASCFELQRDLFRAGAAIVFLTRQHCIQSCVQAMRAGAVDFLTLPCDPVRLMEALRLALSEACLLRAGRREFGALLAKHEMLTLREREIFVLVSSGLMNKQIAQLLNISEITVQIHRGRVMRKMGAQSFASLVRMADVLRPQPGPEANRPSPTVDVHLSHGAQRNGAQRNRQSGWEYDSRNRSIE